jgi:hypothetical protein
MDPYVKRWKESVFWALKRLAKLFCMVLKIYKWGNRSVQHPSIALYENIQQWRAITNGKANLKLVLISVPAAINCSRRFTY